MRIHSHLVLATLLVLPGLLGCSYTHLYGETMRGVDLKTRGRMYVVHQPEDKQSLNSMISSRLEQEGFDATTLGYATVVPHDADVLVTYEDHWQWDMSMYLITLRIDFRDPVTNELLASGQSYRTSLDRKPPEFMVDEIITAMFVPGERP